MQRAIAAFFLFAAFAAPASAAELFSVAGVSVDATAPSATAARDVAVAQGRPTAWQRLFRRLTPSAVWPRQPQLDGGTLQRIVTSFEVGNERRSTTRYLADITYHFNEAAVRQILREAQIPYVETQARPVLVIPLVDGRFDAMHAWTEAWAAPSVADGIVPVLLPLDDAADQALLQNPDLMAADWARLGGAAERYGVDRVVVADAAAEGAPLRFNEVTEEGVRSETLTGGGSFAEMADAVVLRISEEWKNSAAVDYSRRARLMANVQFQSPADWVAIRSRLQAVRSVADMHVSGLSVREARIELSYFGGVEQLRRTMAQQYLDLQPAGGSYRLRLIPRVTAAAE